jgi:hypothetical protein
VNLRLSPDFRRAPGFPHPDFPGIFRAPADTPREKSANRLSIPRHPFD